jgi:hypothetical protein
MQATQTSGSILGPRSGLVAVALIAGINTAGNVDKLSYIANKHPCRAEGTTCFTSNSSTA